MVAMRNSWIYGLLLLIVVFAGSLQAAQYEFSSGRGEFGKATHYEGIVSQPTETENLRSNKDAALLAPPYGIFSGAISTDPSSLYHENSRSGLSGSGGSFATGSTVGAASGGIAFGGSIVTSELLPSTSLLGYNASSYHTLPQYYEDGSIGVLQIPHLNRSLSVYEGESLENMKKGIGHFESTSAWDGNVGLAGHNRGASPYFAFVKDLSLGDLLTYSTLYGSRNYRVTRKEVISETDYSGLTWTLENTLSLITCVTDQPSQRWLVQAVEIKS